MWTRLCAAWKKHALEKDELSVRIGRWNIPGEPIVILVDFQPFFEKKDDIYTEMWNRYQVDSTGNMVTLTNTGKHPAIGAFFSRARAILYRACILMAPN